MKIEHKIGLKIAFHKAKLIAFEYLRAMWAAFLLMGLLVSMAAFWIKVFF